MTDEQRIAKGWLCRIGWHRWKVAWLGVLSGTYSEGRICQRCGKTQVRPA